jgi:mRNA-degrading endonuclease RelE of RelBE toxin-antitoxin system
MELLSYASFKREYDALDTESKAAITVALQELADANSLHELTAVKKIVGKKSESFFRKRVGKYRIIFKWHRDAQTIILYKVEPRKDVYK